MSDRKNNKNPWLSIPASDYEGHMGSPGVGQLEYLSGVFREMLDRFRPPSVAVLGCATGNGFEHIDPDATKRVVGVDINPEYIAIAGERFGRKIPGLRLLCRDIAACDIDARSFDLIHCALVLEYIEPRIVAEKSALWLRPGGFLSVVLQLEVAGHDPVTETAYKSLSRLAPIMRVVEPGEFVSVVGVSGFSVLSSRVDTLESGKRFHVGVYRLET